MTKIGYLREPSEQPCREGPVTPSPPGPPPPPATMEVGMAILTMVEFNAQMLLEVSTTPCFNVLFPDTGPNSEGPAWTDFIDGNVGAGYTAQVGGVSFTGGPSRIYAFPFVNGDRAKTFSSITVFVKVGGAGDKARFGIYSNSADRTIYPNQLLTTDPSDLEISCTVGGGGAVVVKTLNTPFSLSSNTLYWMCVHGNFATISFEATQFRTGFGVVPGVGTLQSIVGWFADLAYATLPASFPAGASAFLSGGSTPTNPPIIIMNTTLA